MYVHCIYMYMYMYHNVYHNVYMHVLDHSPCTCTYTSVHVLSVHVNMKAVEIVCESLSMFLYVFFSTMFQSMQYTCTGTTCIDAHIQREE